MDEPSSADSADLNDARWSSRHWWSRDYTLTAQDKIIASAQFRGSRATAAVGNRRYDLRRFRKTPITISDSASGELVARFGSLPTRGGMPAEFADGETFRWGWVNWWRHEWAWINDAGETVLRSRRSMFPARYELHLEPAADRKTWPLLALLELATRELARPFF